MWMILLHFQLAAGALLPAPVNLSITSFNMEHMLSFLPGPETPPSCRFTVEALQPRRQRTWKQVAGCSQLMAAQTCNLTLAFQDPFGQYQARIRAYVSNLTSPWTLSSRFQPATDTVLGPPDVSVSGCGNCLLLQVGSSTTRGGQVLDLHQQLEVLVRRTRDGTQFSLNFRYQDNLVITYLQPGVEYCVAVSVRTFFRARSVASEPRCAFTSNPQQPASLYVLCGLVGAFCSLALLLGAAVFCSSRLSFMLLKTIKTLKLSRPGAPGHPPHSSTTGLSPHVSPDLSGDSWVRSTAGPKVKIPLF